MLFKLIRERLAPYSGLLLGLVLLQLVNVGANLYLPTLNADIIDKGVTKGDTGFIWSTGGIMLAVSLVQIVGSIGAAFFGARIAMFFGRDTRGAIFRSVGRFSAREMNQFGAPSLITRSTNDVQQVQTLVLMSCTLMVGAPIMMIGGVIMALRQDAGLSWLVLVAVIVLGVAVGSVVRKMVPGFRLVQKRIDVVNRVMREHLSGVRVIRAFTREPYEERRFDEATDSLTEISTKVGSLMMIMFPMVITVMNLSTIGVWWFGAHQVADGEVQIGSLSAYMTYLIQILMSVMMATFMFMMIPRASVAAERITEVIGTEPSVVPPPKPVTPGDVRGVVELNGATMQYPGADDPVLRSVDLRAEPGQTIAIIGSTGSGKSTLLSLIARLFDTTSGTVRIDGVDVRDLDPQLLWGHIGIVPQKAYLFSGTIASNLRYGNPDATDEQLWQALEVAQARDFVERMDGGLQAAVTQGGTNVSGGQRQRLCIARALVAQPRIYLFDDSFSALDLATDRRLREALAPHVREATVFIVAQRVSTIRNADTILVLDDGHVVGAGTHDDLLVSSEEYREIVASQGGTAEEAA
ncbi:multidrug ABC transporter ATP-binding protein [Flexivirga endophytica]|uniref:Multidrug ABC transporter ATP-binding protein n=1 Tax=Flexivirga endophytica TaxID=1849103 RepID=A0A916T3P9_9MICO|nr:ABC transporter ATP-binding protein [Flexivirga endophytica]GGB30029.1 multidrug ABC transporter ATP-binding protein [Flexivirga endophytica]GHB50969.1 multidrug ABC transporter ATP-binding protein [Flexivirga endophytica]